MHQSSTQHVVTCCPFCGATIDAATALEDDAQPKEEDLAVCICCGTILIFNSSLTLRMANQDDIQKLSEEEMKELQKYSEAVLMVLPESLRNNI